MPDVSCQDLPETSNLDSATQRQTSYRHRRSVAQAYGSARTQRVRGWGFRMRARASSVGNDKKKRREKRRAVLSRAGSVQPARLDSSTLWRSRDKVIVLQGQFFSAVMWLLCLYYRKQGPFLFTVITMSSGMHVTVTYSCYSFYVVCCCAFRTQHSTNMIFVQCLYVLPAPQIHAVAHRTVHMLGWHRGDCCCSGTANTIS